MNRAAIAAGITAGLALAVPASARAGDLTSQPWARAGIDAAVKHWGDWPRACPSITVSASLPGDPMMTTDDRGMTVAYVPRIGALTAADCRVIVNRAILPLAPEDAQLACNMLVHEYGHLLGFEHPEDPGTGVPTADPIMHATFDAAGAGVPECRPKPAAKRKARVKVKRAKAHRYHVVN
jgi:hypothetical protein